MMAEIGHDYLVSRNKVFNGGLIMNYISQIKVSNINNNTIVQTGTIDVGLYVKNYFLNSTKLTPIFDTNNLIVKYDSLQNSNLITTTSGIIWIILSFTLGFIPFLFWFLWLIIKNHPRIQSYCNKNSRIFPWKSNLYKPIEDQSIEIISKNEIRKKRKYFLNKILIYSFICGILSISLIIIFTISVLTQILLQNKLQNTNDNNSLVSSWKQLSKNIELFFNLIMIDSYQTFNQSINISSYLVQNQLTNSLNQLTSNIMSAFGVNQLFATLNSLLTNLNITVNSMTFIANNSKVILSRIDELLGTINAHRDNLQSSMSSVCSELNNSKCQIYLIESNQIRVPIITNSIHTDSSINMLFIFKQFHINMDQLTNQIQSLQSSFNNQLRKLTDDKVNELNVAKSINDVIIFWSYISGIILPTKSNFLETSNFVSTNILLATTIFSIVTIITLILILVLIIFYLFSVWRYIIMYNYERIILIDDMNASAIQPIFVLHHIKKQLVIKKLKDKYVFPNWSINTYFLTLSCILLIPAVISILLIFTGELLYNEACTQFWNPDGLQNTDKILNSYLTNQWQLFKAYISSLNSPVQINLSKPDQIIKSILNNCTNDTGLLSVLKLTNLINISSFVWSPENINVLTSGLNLTYKTLIELNTKNLVPTDMNTFLITIKNITAYFDAIDYTGTINELSKGIIEMNNLPQWLNDSKKFFSTVDSKQNFLVLGTLSKLQSLLPKIDDLGLTVKSLNESFVQIQKSQIISSLIKQLLAGLTVIEKSFQPSPETYTIVSNAYHSIMLVNFTTQTDILLSSQVNIMLGKLFPCKVLSESIVLTLNNFCNNNQILEILVNYGFVFAFLSIILLLIFHFHWVLIRLDLRENSEKNVSTC